MDHWAETATRAFLKVESGAVLWRIGALKRSVEGGLDQMSVEGEAVMLNSAGRSASLGTAWIELVNFRPDMISIVDAGFFGRYSLILFLNN